MTTRTLLPECEQELDARHDCSSELIMLRHPEQAIIVLHHNPYFAEIYLRYLPETAAGREPQWRFAGHYQPNVKYFPPRHRVIMFGQRPYLTITEQGASGLGPSTEVDTWLDLADSEFRPVFSFTSAGEINPRFQTISRRVQATVSSLKTAPAESITVMHWVDFFAATSDDLNLLVGRRSDEATYTRMHPGERFLLDKQRSKISADEVHRLYEDLDANISNEDFLKYDFESLREIASGSDPPAKRWLREFLTQCRETSEKRQLAALLGVAPPSKPSRRR